MKDTFGGVARRQGMAASAFQVALAAVQCQRGAAPDALALFS
ncbi:hypothetical protein [Labrys wisconsinensis]|uniref:Uncharacterized protein n=1 Tax=Labrys wisconsinensis TaxID=425677 RepID=A0ABU0JF92_9HYPH|nr:hypothetical protein [Labrys wisconsinensis]MDQ0472956.1 hypothetical protein [Labrys wisconsinensis]